MENTGGKFGEILERIQFIDPKLLKEILIDLIIFLAITNLLLFIFTVVHRIYVDRRDKKYREYYELYTQELIEAIFGEEKITPPKTSLQKEAFADVCVEMRRKFKGEVGEKAREFAEKYGVVDYLFKLSRSCIAYTRITAIEKLSYLGVERVRERIHELLSKEKNEWIRWRLAFCLSLITRDLKDVESIIEILSSLRFVSFKFMEFIWVNIINKFEEAGNIEELGKFIREKYMNDRKYIHILRAFAEAIGNLRLFSLSNIILEIYKTYGDDPIVRISCIRALGNMGYENFCEIFMDNYRHSDWRVRAIASKYAYLCPYEIVADKLKELMSDESYYVRINAGKSLLFFGEQAKPVLEELLESSDRFTRDTARYLIEELKLKNA